MLNKRSRVNRERGRTDCCRYQMATQRPQGKSETRECLFILVSPSEPKHWRSMCCAADPLNWELWYAALRCSLRGSFCTGSWCWPSVADITVNSSASRHLLSLQRSFQNLRCTEHCKKICSNLHDTLFS